MKPINLKQVNNLCDKLKQLKDHERDFAVAMTEFLPEDQMYKQQLYASDLYKSIKKLEKEIELL